MINKNWLIKIFIELVKRTVWFTDSFRPQLQTASEFISSWFFLHTETGNIWTHGISIFLFLPNLLESVYNPAGTSFYENLMVTLYMIASIICVICSTACHTLECGDLRTYQLGIKIDFFGIWCSQVFYCLPSIHFAFRCDPFLNVSSLYRVLRSILRVFIYFWWSQSLSTYRNGLLT